jgi:hypothetical protein
VERINILNRAGTFLGAGIEPDARTCFERSVRHEIEDSALVPPHGRRENRKLVEDIRIFQPKVNRKQTAQRRAAETGVARIGKCPVVRFDERLQFFDEHAAISVGASAAKFFIAGGSVFVQAFIRVVNSDDNERLDCSLRDQGVRCFTNVPEHSRDEGRRGVEKILTVFEVEDGETKVGAFFVNPGSIDDDVALLGDEARLKLFVLMKLAWAGGGQLGG